MKTEMLALEDIIDILPNRFEIYMRGTYVKTYNKEDIFKGELLHNVVLKIDADEDDVCVFLLNTNK